PVGGLTFDLVLSNPPYLSEAEWRGAEPEVREWEPRAAMVAGQGGLALIAALVAGVEAVLRPDGWFGLEVGSAQGETVTGFISDTGRFRSIRLHDDLTGRQRYVFARRLTHDQH
ncbi:MAG: peptide chain release factor N(5)-glutamine methyltransferase, partial [Gemmatimonadota bacterium]|nr:peptide chain release factor N(5)-glutamine methyltransferase [Gemmatimonadota bacterium]